jgi:flagellar motor switch protein FliM
VIAELGKAAITVSELFELKVGDVIKLSSKINQEVEVSIAGRRKLAARPGTLDGKKAVRVTRQLTDEDLVEHDILFKGEIPQ